jgi:Arc/MetJ-type ribon-helix-helix transcriptional regulator
MIRTEIRLTEQQANALKDLAARRKISVSELVRQAVENMLRPAGGPTPEERKQRALAAVGRFHSGQTDLSTNHDQYLADAFGE